MLWKELTKSPIGHCETSRRFVDSSRDLNVEHGAEGGGGGGVEGEGAELRQRGVGGGGVPRRGREVEVAQRVLLERGQRGRQRQTT